MAERSPNSNRRGGCRQRGLCCLTSPRCAAAAEPVAGYAERSQLAPALRCAVACTACRRRRHVARSAHLFSCARSAVLCSFIGADMVCVGLSLRFWRSKESAVVGGSLISCMSGLSSAPCATGTIRLEPRVVRAPHAPALSPEPTHRVTI